MNRGLTAARPLLTPLREWGARLISIAAVVALGVVIGTQYVQPDKRVLAIMAGVIMIGVAWRMSMVQGLGLLVVALLYPRGTVFGNTNFALILVLLVLWFVRMAVRQADTPRRTPLDFAIGGLLLAFIVSFYNVEPGNFSLAFQNFQIVIAGMLTFYLIVNNLKTNQDLMRFHVFQTIALTTACLLSVYELVHGGTLIPGWISFSAGETSFATRNVRVGGPFFDFELMSEFCALNLLLVGFLWLRATTVSRKVLLAGVFVLTAFILFATVTRGSIMALGAGVLYGLWVLRRRLRLVPLVVVTALAIASFLAMNFYVANFTRSGDLLARLGETKFYGGIPDSRIGAWTVAWERFLQHPIIGHGPLYSHHTGIKIWYWPHNVYLYIANLVGVVGLSFFLLLLWKLVRISWPRQDDLRDPNYARAFLTVAHVQLVVFAIDELKIDFLRNLIYQFQPWILFASIVAAHRIANQESAPPPAPR